MILSIHSLLENNTSVKSREIEDSLDGNICRCTGYRPILDAFKSLASEASQDLCQNVCDIEVSNAKFKKSNSVIMVFLSRI